MSLTKIYIASNHLFILLNNLVYRVNYHNSVISSGIIVDNEKFIKGYLNYFSESKLSKQFWRKNIVVIYNSLYHREDILNLEKIFKELNYRQIKLICEKDIINFNKKEVFMINDEIYRIFYINESNTKRTLALDPEIFSLNEIKYLLQNRCNNKTLYLIGGNDIDYGVANYYYFESIDEFFLKK